MSQKIRVSIFLAAAIIMAFILFYIVFAEHSISETNYFLLEQEQKRDATKEIETMQKETDSTEKIQEIEQKTIRNDLKNTEEVKNRKEVENIEEVEKSISTQKICVFVCGKVKKAGTYKLLEGSRLSDFIHAAGGFSKHAAKEYLNLAEKAEDGQRIYVPSKKEAKKWKRESRNNSIENNNSQENQNNQNNLNKQVSESRKVNINTAGKEELMTLSGIGEAKADAILAYREEQGAFHTIEELMQISGIKEGIYNKLCNDITI